MKRALILTFILGLTLTGCAKKGSIGEGLKGFKGLGSVPPTASPTPTVKKTETAKATQRPTTAVPTRKGNTWTLTIRNTGEGYVPHELRVLIGDTIIFKNEDPNSVNIPKGHTFTGDKKEWESPVVSYKGKWVWKVDIAPGFYTWHDEVVPYLVGGPLQVIKP